MPVYQSKLLTPAPLWLLRAWVKPEQGLSLTECLVAIVILSILGLSITPPIFLATGTRVQARRAEQANQIAQGEIDRIRTVIERGNVNVNELPASIGAEKNLKNAAVATATKTISATNPLLTSATCSSVATASRYLSKDTTSATRVASNQVVLVDQDGDCTPDYMMQVYRNNGNATNVTTVPTSFSIGIRVYVIGGNTAAQTLVADQNASLVIGSGPKDVIGGNKRRPISTLYSTITRSDTSGGLSGLCQSLGGTTACPATSPSASPSPTP